MENTFFQDAAGKPFMPIGLQVHNSSTGSNMIKKAIQAVKAYGGNCLEAPVYWCCVEPEQDRYDMELVKGIVDEARSAGLHLILLWFGTSKTDIRITYRNISSCSRRPTGWLWGRIRRRFRPCPCTAGRLWNGIKRLL